MDREEEDGGGGEGSGGEAEGDEENTEMWSAQMVCAWREAIAGLASTRCTERSCKMDCSCL